MSIIVTRSGKGSPLSHTDMDNNLTNLNTDKLESVDLAPYLTSADATTTYATKSEVATILPTQTGNSGKVLSTNGTTPSWVSAGVGSVTSVSFTNANGFTGTVTNPSTTPTISVGTSLTGLLKGTGSGLTSATSGSDFVTPGAVLTSGLTTASGVLLGRTTAGTGAIEGISVGTGLSLSGGTLSATSSAPLSGTKGVQIIKFSTANMAASSTRYLTIGTVVTAATDEAQAKYVFCSNTSVSQLRVHLNAAAVGSSYVVTVRKNGVNTLLTCTIGVGSTDASDLSTNLTFKTGDALSISVVTGAGVTTTTDVFATIITRDETNSYGNGMFWLAGSSGASSLFVGETAGSTTQNQVTVSFAKPYLAMASYGLKLNGTMGQVSTTIYLGNIVTSSDHVHSGFSQLYGQLTTTTDFIACLVGSGVGGEYLGRQISLNNQTANTYPPCVNLFGRTNHAASTTAYLGGLGSAGSTTENDTQIPMPVCVVRNLCVTASANITTNSTTFTIRKNGVDTGVTCTMSAGTAVAVDTSNSVSFSSGDLLSIKVVSGASTGTLSYKASFETVE